MDTEVWLGRLPTRSANIIRSILIVDCGLNSESKSIAIASMTLNRLKLGESNSIIRSFMISVRSPFSGREKTVFLSP